LDLNEGAKAIADALGGGTPPALHMAYRLAALVAGEEIVYADSNLTIDVGQVMSGELILITLSRVVRLTAQESPLSPSSDDATETVRVEVRPRLAPPRLRLRGLDTEWQKDYETWWPKDCTVRMAWDGLKVDLPLSQARRDRFFAVLPKILY
jgi:hypothetical protein